MANIWRKDDNVKEQPKRNIMDLSFQNNLTTQFGKLVPVFCKEFIPGDSFSIKPTFSLKFQPMVFPIQTRMRAHLHFFKVRNRNLWKDWEDFIAKNKENLDPPYLDTAVTKPTTGSLLDYLGVPTTLVGRYGRTEVLPDLDVSTRVALAYDLGVDSPFTFTSVSESTSYSTYKTAIDGISIGDDFIPARVAVKQSSYTYCVPLDLSGYNFLDTIRLEVSFGDIKALHYKYPASTDGLSWYSPLPVDTNIHRGEFLRVLAVSDGKIVHISAPIFTDEGTFFELPSSYQNSVLYLIYPGTNYVQYGAYSGPSSNVSFFGQDLKNLDLHIQVSTVTDAVEDIDDTTSPYWRSGATVDLRERIKLSALPCRAYEQIYNSFYRNAENNPYILNGVPEYNKYVPTDEGGVDANLYDFYYRNWEDDFLTTALQQPQAGIAPLVGLTGTAGTATVTLADEDGNTSEATASYDEEGNVTSVAFANSTSLTEALADAVQYGISINDLRNVNAFQRWLEAKARGGYKYRDVIETMFGITVRYDTLDMPEFIGGTSIDIMVNQISQTVPTETSPLGDYAGQAAGIGTGQTINEYFDEHGFIIGILSVVPVPNYSQLLPKHFIKRDAFDYYFPQFGHIGMQPIKYNEVCPVQSYQDSTEQNNTLDETFGYQRAWYDYLASTDEVHGEFRTNLRNFVMNRTFDTKPELVKEFLTVDPSQLNDVFAIRDDSYDKILGQIFFDVKAKRPIPLYGIPKLE